VANSFSALTLLDGWQERHPAYKNWVVGCWRGYLSGATCRLVYGQLMPLPLTVSCFSKIYIGFAFLVPAHLGSPRKMVIKRVCVCQWQIIKWQATYWNSRDGWRRKFLSDTTDCYFINTKKKAAILTYLQITLGSGTLPPPKKKCLFQNGLNIPRLYPYKEERGKQSKHLLCR